MVQETSNDLPVSDSRKESNVTTKKQKDAALAQFPSDQGENKVEIAERTPDTEKATESRFVKEYVIGTGKGGTTEISEETHDNNRREVLQQAINLGLHPKGEAELIGTEVHADGISVSAFYEVEVVPAHVDHETDTTLTPTLSTIGDDGKAEAPDDESDDQDSTEDK